MFYTSKNPKIVNLPEKKTYIATFWQTIENRWRMFYSSILNVLSIVVQLFNQIQNHWDRAQITQSPPFKGPERSPPPLYNILIILAYQPPPP